MDKVVNVDSSDRYRIRLATADDNIQLLELTSRNPMKGNISLRIDRNPDFFSLLHLRGNFETIVCEEKGKIIGCLSVSKTDHFVNSDKIPIWYLSDFKVDREYRNTGIGHDLARHCLQLLESRNADLLFCTTAKGNDRVLGFFKGRGGLPLFQKAAAFKVLQMLPLIFKRKHKNALITSHLSEEEEELLIKTFNKYQLGKATWISGLDNRIYIKYQDGKDVMALISVIDTSTLKQNVVIDASRGMKFLIKSLSKLYDITGVFPFPGLGSPIKICYIDGFYVREGMEECLRVLIQEARHYLYQQNLHFLTIGLDLKDPYLSLFNRTFHLNFDSTGYISSLKNNRQLLSSIVEGILYEDFSLV
ncbi:MAG: GNAT family N-acetyltransferase [Saprospiraceae bacterium]|nr:GNAT family N-acetyltransferase [Saprospiraceae bacterium]